MLLGATPTGPGIWDWSLNWSTVVAGLAIAATFYTARKTNKHLSEMDTAKLKLALRDQGNNELKQAVEHLDSRSLNLQAAGLDLVTEIANNLEADPGVQERAQLILGRYYEDESHVPGEVTS